jgi:hypothetical protein
MSTTKSSAEKPDQSKQGGAPTSTPQQPLTKSPSLTPLPKVSGTTAPPTSKSTEIPWTSDRPNSSSGSKKEVSKYDQDPRRKSSSDSFRSDRSDRSTYSTRRRRSRSRESDRGRRDSRTDRDYDDYRYEKSDKYSEKQDRNDDDTSRSSKTREKRDQSSTRDDSPPRTKVRRDSVPQTPAATPSRPQTPKKDLSWTTSLDISKTKFAAKYIIPPKGRHWTLVVPDWAEMLKFDTPGLLTTKQTTQTFEKEIAIDEVTKHVIALLGKDKAPSKSAAFYVRILYTFLV